MTKLHAPTSLRFGRQTQYSASSGRVRSFLRKYIAYAALAFLVVFFGLTAPHLFMTTYNMRVILQNSAVQCIVAFGMTFVIIIGCIDLSVGSVMGFSGMVAAIAAQYVGGGALFLTVLIGGCIGFANGLVFVYGRIPSFIVTLGTLSIVSGATLIVSGGMPVSLAFNGFFMNAGVPPIPLLVFVVLALILTFVLKKTVFGRYALAIGGDEEKARVLGLPVKRMKLIVFTLSGLLAGLGGGILTAEVGAGSPTLGTGFELTAISAVVIGGTALTGGGGSVLGTVVGSLVMSTLANGMIILGVGSEIQIVLTGVVLVGAVLISTERGKIRIIK